MKNIFRWFKENVLGVKKVFKLKVKESCFSPQYYCFKFSNNNGWTWEYIIRDEPDVYSYCDELEPCIKYFQACDVESRAKDFSTYEKCREHNDWVMDKINKTNKQRREKYYNSIENAKSFAKKFNKK